WFRPCTLSRPTMNLKRATDRESTRKAPSAAAAPAPTNGNGHGGNGASAYIGDGQSQVGRRLSDFLLAEGLITAAHFTTVIAEQQKTNEKLATIESVYENTRAGLASALSEAEADVVPVEETTDSMNLSELRASADQVPVVRLVTMILVEGIQRGASDIHLEPGEKTLHVRFRIDGVLQDIMTPAKKLEPAIVSRLKIMANLDIAERRLPQDGRIKFRDASREIDFRVSIIPALFGESVVLRILDKSALQLDMAQLGFDPHGLAEFQKAIKSPP